MFKRPFTIGLLLSVILTACAAVNQPAASGTAAKPPVPVSPATATPPPLPPKTSSATPNTAANLEPVPVDKPKPSPLPRMTSNPTSPTPAAAAGAGPDPVDALPRDLPIEWPDPDIQIGSISFISMQEGWGLINNGLYRTTDGGLTWQEIAAIPARFHSLDFVDQMRGWALGDDGLYATIDGGRHWQKQVDAPYGWGPVMDFTSPTDGWLVKRDELFHTQDGGATWQPVTVPVLPESPQAGRTMLPTVTVEGLYLPLIADLSFISPRTGWLLYQRCNAPFCGSWLFQTIDGGTTWKEIAQSPTDKEKGALPLDRSGHGIFFLDESHGWFVGAPDYYLVTSDSGIRWERGPGKLPGLQASLSHIKMFSTRSGLGVVRSTIVNTNDGGQTWQPVIPTDINALK